MTGREYNPTLTTTLGLPTYGGTHGGCTHNSSGGDPYIGHTIRRQDTTNDEYRLVVVVSSITRNDDSSNVFTNDANERSTTTNT